VHADADYEDEEYIKDYIKMGFKKMAFTDHCPEKNEIDKRQNMRMRYSQKQEYLNSIQKLKKKYANQIEIQSGYEVEYLPGEEENIMELKNETDKLILGQHFIYDDNKNLKIFGKDDFTDEELLRYAEYIDKAMQLNIPDIIAHPDLFMLRREEFGKIEQKVAHKICQSAEKYKIPLEINLAKIYHSIKEGKEISYPCKGFWEIAAKYQIKVLYGIDAHYRGQILLWNELVKLANGVIGKEIIEKLDFIEE